MLIHQALHGYKDGHTLLASSLDLPSEIKRYILPITDMSGGSMVAGFEEYLTGYPLKQVNKYALAKTWYAPEMKRPGCVWTHTLLFEFSDLPKIDDIDLILSLFKRPSTDGVKLSEYSCSLKGRFEKNSIANYLELEDSSNKNLIQEILHLLYSESDKAILVRAGTTSLLERWFLKIWRQQWPRLRRNFSFSTGSIATRSFNGKLLELQVIPFKSETLAQYVNEILVLNSENTYKVTSNEWVDLSYRDLNVANDELKNFFNFFGSEASAERKSFKELAETFIFFNSIKPSLQATVQFLATLYPIPDQGNNIKSQVLYNQNRPLNTMLPSYEEEAILVKLATTNFHKSFDYVRLDFLPRFLNYFKDVTEYKIKLLKEIIKNDPNFYGEKAITELADQFGKYDSLDTLWLDKQLSSVFVSLNPRLTYNMKYWLANESNQIEIISQLQKHDFDSKIDWSIIVKLLIDTKSNIDPNIIKVLNAKIEAIILDCINMESASIPGKNWLNYLQRRPQAILEWLNSQKTTNKRVIGIIVSILNPNSEVVIHNGLRPWIDFLSKQEKSSIDIVPIEVNSFCLSLVFNINESRSQRIFELVFEIIYVELSQERLSYHLWRELEVHTKPLSFWKDWDKCKKLLNAVVDQYLKNDWEINTLVNNVHGKELKTRIAHQYKKRK